MNRYLRFAFMAAAFGSAVVAGINPVAGNVGIASPLPCPRSAPATPSSRPAAGSNHESPRFGGATFSLFQSLPAPKTWSMAKNA